MILSFIEVKNLTHIFRENDEKKTEKIALDNINLKIDKAYLGDSPTCGDGISKS